MFAHGGNEAGASSRTADEKKKKTHAEIKDAPQERMQQQDVLDPLAGLEDEDDLECVASSSNDGLATHVGSRSNEAQTCVTLGASTVVAPRFP